MIKCLIIDDEPLAIEVICDYINQFSDLQLVATTTNPLEGMEITRQKEIDLLFLDVQMPDLTGIDFLRTIKTEKCHVILTTAHPQYALDGFELNVLDYLLKPIRFERFQRAIEKFRQAMPSSRTEPLRPEHEDFIFVRSEHKFQKIEIQEIQYIEGLKDYISIFTVRGRIVTLQNMKRMEEVLPESLFCRVHRSYIVSLPKIERVEKSKILLNSKVIPIGDTYRENFFKKIENRNI